MDFNHRLQESA